MDIPFVPRKSRQGLTEVDDITLHSEERASDRTAFDLHALEKRQHDEEQRAIQLKLQQVPLPHFLTHTHTHTQKSRH